MRGRLLDFGHAAGGAISRFGNEVLKFGGTVVQCGLCQALDDGVQLVLDRIEAAELSLGMFELGGELVDVRLNEAQALDVRTRGDPVEDAAEALFELVETAAEREEGVVWADVVQRLLDAGGDVGKAGFDRIAADFRHAMRCCLLGARGAVEAVVGRFVDAGESLGLLAVPGVLGLGHDAIHHVERIDTHLRGGGRRGSRGGGAQRGGRGGGSMRRI